MLRSNPIAMMETQELIEKLVAAGYGEIIKCMLLNENKCYTKKNRLNKSATCRELGINSKELEDAFCKMRELLPELALTDPDEEAQPKVEKKELKKTTVKKSGRNSRTITNRKSLPPSKAKGNRKASHKTKS
jgi:hypothetical protein